MKQKFIDNWKTTVAGLGTLCTAVYPLIQQYLTPILPPASLKWILAIAGFIGGIGLMAAKDGKNKSSVMVEQVISEHPSLEPKEVAK